MAYNSGDIAEILYSSGTAGEKTLFNQNGDRKLVNLDTEIKYTDDIYVDKAVLTLLNKESNLYSLSIKVKKDKVFNLDSQKFKGQRLYSRASETYITQDGTTKLSHMLFIGTVGNADDGNFKINKTILITNDVGKGQEKKYADITDEEEYLNLHHIDYFSFMYDDFYTIYTEYLSKNSNTDTSKQPNSQTIIADGSQDDGEGSVGEASSSFVGSDDEEVENDETSSQARDNDDGIKLNEEEVQAAKQAVEAAAAKQAVEAAAAKQAAEPAAAKQAAEPAAAKQAAEPKPATAVEMGGGKKKVKKTKKAKKV